MNAMSLQFCKQTMVSKSVGGVKLRRVRDAGGLGSHLRWSHDGRRIGVCRVGSGSGSGSWYHIKRVRYLERYLWRMGIGEVEVQNSMRPNECFELWRDQDVSGKRSW